TIELANTGDSKLTGFVFVVNTVSSSVSKESSKVLDSGTSLTYTINIADAEISESPKEVEVIPIVSKGSEIKHCNEQTAFTSINC
ncbi:hypothetical protein HOG16_03755, partial [Candidatus Woesearchaeota archaeon]|nr:hypothetical protein [Candidatus Woesearchaeota archaeon]